MKRKDLMSRIAEHARASNAEMIVVEGGSHTKITVGRRRTVVPRHNEVNEITAKAILKQIGAGS